MPPRDTEFRTPSASDPPPPEDGPIVIVGGGMAADAAARGIRMVDEDRDVILVSEEPTGPYDRPPLSKGLWSRSDPGDDEFDQVDRDTAAEKIEVRTGLRVEAIHRAGQTIELSDGTHLDWSRLILATGAEPLIPSWASNEAGEPTSDKQPADSLRIIGFRTFDDYRLLREHVQAEGAVVVLGGGFIGTEVSAALAGIDHAPVLAFRESAPLGHLLPDPFPELAATHLTQLGVDLRPNVDIEHRGQLHDLVRSRIDKEAPGSRPGPLAVLGLGVRPRTEMAEKAGLDTGPSSEPGILVDGELRTSDPRIFAAGDAVRFPCSFLGGFRIRTEHEDHANESGVHAGMGAAGEARMYDPIPAFYSGMGDIVWEALGRISGGDRVRVEAGRRPADPGMAIVRHQGQLQGVLIWNRPGRRSRAERLLTDPSAADIDPDDEDAVDEALLALLDD